jgi:excisionase family DNA binding protein
MRDLMTPDQIADLLQIDGEAVERLIREGRLATVKVSGDDRVARRDLEAFLAADDTLPTLRETLFRRVMAVADRNPGLSSDDVLDELEQLDAQAREKDSIRNQN